MQRSGAILRHPAIHTGHKIHHAHASHHGHQPAAAAAPSPRSHFAGNFTQRAPRPDSRVSECPYVAACDSGLLCSVDVLACVRQARRKMQLTCVGVGRLKDAHRIIRASFTSKTSIAALHGLASSLISIPERNSLKKAPQLVWHTRPAGVPQGAADQASAGSGTQQGSERPLVLTTCEDIHGLLHEAVCLDTDVAAAAQKARSELQALMPDNTLYIDWEPEVQAGVEGQLSTGAGKKQGLYKDKNGKIRAPKAPRQAWHQKIADTHIRECPRYVRACPVLVHSTTDVSTMLMCTGTQGPSYWLVLHYIRPGCRHQRGWPLQRLCGLRSEVDQACGRHRQEQQGPEILDRVRQA